MHAHHTVVDLASVAIVLPRGTNRLLATLGRTGFIHAADRFSMSVFFGHNLLASISKSIFIPLDRLQKAL
jgi:hypothetical protein